MKSLFGLAIIAFWLAAFVGWFLNIYKVIETIGGDITALFVARLFGILAAPLGSILGYF